MGGKTATVVDDGVATGASMKAALRVLKRRLSREIIVAIPVAPSDTAMELAAEADRLVCLERPARFVALSCRYRDFPQLTDEEVVAILRQFGVPPPANGTV